jgi:phosphoribosylanthranilate isomerase
MRTRVKICGITSVDAAQSAAAHGADAIGLIFYRPSPRYVTVDHAAKIVESAPAFVTTVAVFVNPTREEVQEVIRYAGVAMLQFHGDETPGFCAGFDRPYIKAARLRPGLDLLEYLAPHRTAKAWMLDAYHDDLWGGTGGAFDWNMVPAETARPVILSGGLTADNVGEAIRRVHPYAVDVSTGVESAKGVKDPKRIAAFVAGVRNADAGLVENANG